MNTHEQDNVNEINSFRALTGCSVCQKFPWLKHITVEPVIFVYALSYTLATTLISNLLLEKVCLQKFNATVQQCSNLSSNTTLQNDVEKETAQILLYCDLAGSIPSVLLGPIVGAYSDKYGRKLVILFPLAGYILGSISHVIFSVKASLCPQWAIFGEGLRGIFGGFPILLMACYSYVSDTSQTRSRTGRVGFVTMAFALSGPVGLLLSAFLFTQFGYWPVFATTAILLALAFIYVIIRIDNDVARHSMMTTLLSEENSSWLSVRSAIFTVLGRNRPNYGRSTLLLLLLAIVTGITAFTTYKYLFLFTKKMFNWNYNAFVYFNSISLSLEVFVSTAIVVGLSYKLGVEDRWLGVVSCLFGSAAYLCRALARTETILYIGSCFSSVTLVAGVVLRSLISKCVSFDELGKIYAVLSVLEGLFPLLLTPVYTLAFEATVDHFAGAIFLAGVGGYFGTAIIFVLLLVIHGWQLKNENQLDCDQPPLLDDAEGNHQDANCNAGDVLE